MQLVRFNSKVKANRCIFALGKRVKDWKRVENILKDNTDYLVWYESSK